MKIIQIKINRDLGKHKKGTQLKIEVDKNGIPLDQYWRNRLSDSKIDNCCELIEKTPPKKSSKRNVKS